jgi:hypothetical protein
MSPPETRSGGKETAEEETVAIQSRARALVTLFEEKESQLMPGGGRDLDNQIRSQNHDLVVEIRNLFTQSRGHFAHSVSVSKVHLRLEDFQEVQEVEALPPLHSSLARDFLFSNKNFQRSNP